MKRNILFLSLLLFLSCEKEMQTTDAQSATDNDLELIQNGEMDYLRIIELLGLDAETADFYMNLDYNSTSFHLMIY